MGGGINSKRERKLPSNRAIVPSSRPGVKHSSDTRTQNVQRPNRPSAGVERLACAEFHRLVGVVSEDHQLDRTP
jgi:hypothetical protein